MTAYEQNQSQVIRGGSRRMPTKELTKDELMPANSLRSISQKDLIEKAKKVEKLGVISNNDLSLAVLEWEKYESFVDMLREQEETIKRYKSLLEDIELAERYGKRIEEMEDRNTQTYEVNSAEDITSLLNKRG